MNHVIVRKCLVFATLLFCCCTSAMAQKSLDVKIGNGVTRLDEIGLYEVGYRYRNGKEGAMPLGWTGHFDDKTGISCTPFGTQAGKQVFLIHPIWRGGTGVTDQTFHLTLPQATRVDLRFAVAMKEGDVGPQKSDGATFRVFIDDKKLFDLNKSDAVWSNETLDLAPYSGKTVVLRFESDPGPRDDPSFDYAFWGDRELLVEGASFVVADHPLFTAKSYPLNEIKRQAEGACPPLTPIHDRPVLTTKTTSNSTEVLQFLSGWTGYVHGSSSTNALQRSSPELNFGYGAYLELVEPDGHIVRSDSDDAHPQVFETALPNGAGIRRDCTYQVRSRTIHVLVTLYRPHGAVARVTVNSAEGYISAIHFGGIGPSAYRRTMLVPYYGSVDYLPDLGLFANTAIDHTVSQASSIDGTTARYEPLTDGKRLPVKESAFFALSPDIYSVLPEPSNAPSPYREQLGNQIVMDAWGGRYVDHAAWLRELASYHLTHLLTIVHDWQNGGYDNKLPDVLPAQARLGGDEGMKEWVKTATGLGESIALHENYVDFYPNAASFTNVDVAHDSNGERIKAWFNEGTRIQSFAVAPDSILKYAKRITPEVHNRFGTNASYLDVHSAVPPWFHVDFRPDREGAGTFREVWNAHKDLWALFRKVHGGPVLGEGNNHWYWSGLLDGIEAQFGTGWPSNGGQTAPLFVDFDLTAIHPLQFNHGMGYLERWLDPTYEAEWRSTIPTMQVLDQYRMQEVAFGHAGFIAAPLVHNLPFIWQEHNLMLPVTSQYATARPVTISYDSHGHYQSTNEAIAAKNPFDRVYIVYDNGLTIWANGKREPWAVGELSDTRTLPQYGWYAKGKDLRAGTFLHSADNGDAVVADYAETPATLFVDARSDVVNVRGPLNVQPSASDFEQTGPRQFRMAFSWRVGEAIPPGEQAFVHVAGTGGIGAEKIVTQMVIGITSAPDSWPVGQVTKGSLVSATLPESVADGTYKILVGLYPPNSDGGRVPLTGIDDGNGRIEVGTITVTNGGANIAFTPAPETHANGELKAHQRLAHTNQKHLIVDFGKVATDGSLLLERQKAGEWLLTPFPRDHPFTVRVKVHDLDPKLGSAKIDAIDSEGRVIGSVDKKSIAGTLTFKVNSMPGAVRYRISGR